MNHKWKKLGGTPIKGEIERKQCSDCKLQVRRIRIGSTKPRGGWTETHYRSGTAGPWKKLLDYQKIPKCTHCRECPTCKGTGVIAHEEYMKMKYYE